MNKPFFGGLLDCSNGKIIKPATNQNNPRQMRPGGFVCQPGIILS